MPKRPAAGPAPIHSALLRPFRMATVLTVAMLVISLGFLAYTSWTSARRLQPLERHIQHLQGLQQTSADIQSLLIRHVESRSIPAPDEVAPIRRSLEQLLAQQAHLHPATPDRLRQARGFLEEQHSDPKTGLLAALTVIREALREENALQRDEVSETRRSVELELAVAAGVMLPVPLLAMLLLGAIRKKAFGSMARLARLLENVGNLNFDTTAPVPQDDPLADVYERYNEMASRLREASRAAEAHATALEGQVRAATETLLRQQAELENGARLATVGEFAARLAHELRNPISGISAALSNMEEEYPPGEERDRVRLIAEETARVTALLNRMLEQGRSHLEVPVEVDTARLVEDIVRLMRYQMADGLAMEVAVSSGQCVLPRDTLRQVLINLLRNASEALGNRPGRVRVRMERRDRHVVLSVDDDGPGYPAALLDHGIRPFNTTKPDGTGLGMSIIQRLVRSAGGEIQLGRSERGGALTVVTLPTGE
ncbi:MAG: hypothetical protein KDG55_07990 [Rhodocyclaceae bacterium]|nr:hypothetical protein [Rhodocyclaceae bacterium]